MVVGVDEAGRGPLAGPVIAAAVILDPSRSIDGLNDSKLLSPKKRDQLYDCILDRCLAFAIGRSEPAEIDEINILQASLLAMQRAVEALSIVPERALIDGNRCPALSMPATAIIRGDQSEPCISAASIIAKVTRDREMLNYDEQYPEYGFARHKGYGTRDHYAAIAKHGILAIHRRSFRLT